MFPWKTKLKVFAHNDTNEAIKVRVEAFFFGFLNERVACFDKDLTLAPLSVTAAGEIRGEDLMKYSKRKNGFCVRLYDKDGCLMMQKTVLLDKEKNIALPKAKISAKTDLIDGTVRIHLKSDRFARLVCLQNELSDEAFSDNYFDLLPGQEYTVTTKAPGNTDAEIIKKKIRIFSLCDIRRESNPVRTIKNRARVLSSPVNIVNIIIRAKVPDDIDV